MMFGLVADAVASSSHRHVCAVHRCRILFENRALTVTQARARVPVEEYRSTFVSWRANGRSTALGDKIFGPDSTTALGPFAVAGHFVAYGLRDGGGGPVYGWRVYRLDAETGLRQAVAPVPGGSGQYPFAGAGVLSVVVTPAGTVAWIAAGELASPATRDVVVLPAGSTTPALLASGTSIELNSLAAVPGHVYWSERGAPRQAIVR